ncbi:MAG: hypothetical protein AAGE83_05505 [Pseudomonadota bacterium]
MSDHSNDDTTKNRPADTLRDGSLKATIWRNESEKGPYHTVNLSRTYKDEQGTFHDSQSFRAKDMLPLSELSRQAHYRAGDLNREAFKEQRREAPQQDRNPCRAR